MKAYCIYFVGFLQIPNAYGYLRATAQGTGRALLLVRLANNNNNIMYPQKSHHSNLFGGYYVGAECKVMCNVASKLSSKNRVKYLQTPNFKIAKMQAKQHAINYCKCPVFSHNYSGTSHCSHLTSNVTSPLRSPLLTPKLYSTVQISLPRPVDGHISEVPL